MVGDDEIRYRRMPFTEFFDSWMKVVGEVANDELFLPSCFGAEDVEVDMETAQAVIFPFQEIIAKDVLNSVAPNAINEGVHLDSHAFGLLFSLCLQMYGRGLVLGSQRLLDSLAACEPELDLSLSGTRSAIEDQGFYYLVPLQDGEYEEVTDLDNPFK